jgi:hypothetical protein
VPFTVPGIDALTIGPTGGKPWAVAVLLIVPTLTSACVTV